MTPKPSTLRATLAALLLAVLLLAATAQAQTVRISFNSAARSEPVTGRAYLFVARSDKSEPRRQSGSFRESEPFFGVDVDGLKAGESVTFDASVPGFPVASLDKLPAGDYFVQGMIVPYTQFKRADGHTIWAHMDAGEGQRFNASPGSLLSEAQKVHIDPARKTTLSISLTKTLPEVARVKETPWVKRIHLTSRLASAFWNHPMPLGAVVLLPKGYDENPGRRYPVVYTVGHFSERAPFGFTFDGCDKPETAEARAARLARGLGPRCAVWSAE